MLYEGVIEGVRPDRTGGQRGRNQLERAGLKERERRANGMASLK